MDEGADPDTPMNAPPDGAAHRADTAFLAGGGEMGRRIAELDGAATPLGPLASWSTTLRTAVGICVSSRHPMVIWWGPQLALLYNDAWIPILGPAKHPALGRPGRAVWPEMWHIIGRQLTSVLRTGEATWSDDQLLPAHRFGYLEEAYFTYSYSPIRTGDGQVGGVFTAVTETTGRVLGERRLRTLRELGDVAQAADVEQACSRTLAALATNRADIPFAAVYLLAPDGASARLVATEGLDRAVLPEALPPAGPVGRSIWQAATQGRTVASSGLARRLPGLAGPGHNPVGDADVDTAWAVPLTDAGRDRPFGVLVLGVSPYRAVDADYRSFLDLAADQVSTALTDVQAHEAERRRIDALAELDRAKTEFFTGVSHELRTPLTLIAGPAQDGLADVDAPLPPAQRDRMELIRRNSGRLRRLVDTLLDFARLEGGRLVADLVPVDLAHLTRAIAGTFAPAAEHAGLGFVLDCPDLPSGVLVDPDMWEKIVLNLLSNAVKYTLDGTVTVRLRQGADGATELLVTDTGVGIPAPDLRRVFERFHRVRGAQARSAEGTGIGLALVAELVALHGGGVDVASGPGAGSVFTVRLPATARTDLPASGARTSSSVGLFLDEALSWVRPTEGPDTGPTVTGRIDTGSTTGATVLVAEDNPDLRWYVAGLLRPHYAVYEAADGAQALRIARQHPVDLVLADVMMPELDGFGLLAALRAHPTTAGVPVVLLSARAGEEAAIEGLRAGADDYLTKPFSSHDLVARVRSNLELARLRSHEARWRTAVVDALQDGFSVIDVDSAAIVEINPATTELLGLRPEHLPCGPPYPIFPTAEEDADELALLQAAHAAALGRDHGEVVVPLRHVDTRARVWVSVSYSALPARDGQRACVVATMRDVTAQRRAAERDALLAEVGALLAEQVALRERLDRFARLLSGTLAELVVVSLRGPDGRLAPVAAAHSRRPDVAAARLARAPHLLPPELTRWHRAAPPRRGDPATGGDPDPLLVPLVVAGRLLGTVELGGRDAATLGRDGVLAEELGDRIAGAVDADRVAAREAQLQAVTAALASAGTLAAAAGALAAGVRDALSARAVTVYAGETDGRTLRLVRHAGPGQPPETVRLDGSTPEAHAALAAEPVWSPDAASRLARFPAATGADGASAAVPLLSGDVALGVVVVAFDTTREFPADERDFTTALAGQAAQAFERAALADQRWRLAQTLQRALLPSALPELERLGLAACYQPAVRELQAGGDWFDVFALEGDRVAVVVGDVVGQGPAAAALMGQLRSVLATYLHDGLPPAAALDGLDRATHRIAGARGSTALCLILDVASGEVRWSAAGHLPPLFTGPGGTRFGHGGEGAVLGLAGRAPYVEGRETITAGTSVALYTDGLVERRGEVVDDGLDRLSTAAARLHPLAPGPLAEELLDATLDGADTGDDVALVVVRFLPAPLEVRSPADPALLPATRRMLQRWCAAAGLSEDTTADVALVLSECLSNCVEHAYPDGPGEIAWRVGPAAGGGVQVRVQDFGRWRPPPADPGYRGRGLAVIHALAERVDLDGTPQGTTVAVDMAAATEPLARRAAGETTPQWWLRNDARSGPR
ncbi:SpoIIE family protein phosphatase [Pseudonocardia sp.]|uniref:SpoIIE family protein phosphatase n=1 Tax=Pseudonocardia sp. TaxID=60912 RepID=UPI0026213DC1|nr:SpoIIE family protein phosphatase [Pseudonocardia sp.]